LNSVGTKSIVAPKTLSAVSASTRAIRTAAIAASLALVALAITLPAQAQSARRIRRESNQNRKNRIQRTIDETYSHRWEAGGGGGYLRFQSGKSLQQNSEIAFWANTTYFLSRKLGVTGDIHGAFGNAKVGNNPYIQFDPQISQYAFMAGPQYRFIMKEKYEVSGFVEGGAAIGKFDQGSKGFTSAELGLWPSSTTGAFAAGVNIDYNFYPNLAVRFTPMYLGTTFGSTIQNSKGINVGLMYRFGTK